MTKADIVNEISKSTGIDKATVLETVEKFMEAVKDSLANGENVYLRGFGSFIIKTRSQKTARNISKSTTIIIPEHNIPAFKPAKVFMEVVKLFYLQQTKVIIMSLLFLQIIKKFQQALRVIQNIIKKNHLNMNSILLVNIY